MDKKERPVNPKSVCTDCTFLTNHTVAGSTVRITELCSQFRRVCKPYQRLCLQTQLYPAAISLGRTSCAGSKRTDKHSELLPLSKRRYFHFLVCDSTEIMTLPVGSGRKKKRVLRKLSVLQI